MTGPYTSVNCTLSLLKSSLRKSPLLSDDEYARQGSEDERFVDYFGTIQSIVTSSGNNDSGLFETNLRDERFLPFEGAGAESTWKLDLPAELPAVRLRHHLRRDPAHPLHRPPGRRGSCGRRRLRT